MNVTEAVTTRTSIRAFLDTPIASSQLRELLTTAARAPSGGNLQPWRIYLLGDEAMPRFQSHMAAWEQREKPEYDIYPRELGEPYRSSRFKCGEDMYALLGIPRDDKPARLARMAENFAFFGAPAAFFCFVDRNMGPPQWSDLGMFLQSFMLLAKEAGLDTCAQEIWATRPRCVADFVGADDNLMLFCGMAIGHRDPDASVNTLITDREPNDVWLKEL